MLDKAYPFLKKVYDLDSNYEEINYYLGQYHYQKEEYYKAIPYYNRALLINPKDIYRLEERGYAKLMLEDYKGAYNDCEKIIRIDETNAESWYYLGYIDYYKGDYILAEESYNNAIQYDDTDPRFYLYKGYLYEAMEAYDRACMEWGKAARLGDKEAMTLLYEDCRELLEK